MQSASSAAIAHLERMADRYTEYDQVHADAIRAVLVLVADQAAQLAALDRDVVNARNSALAFEGAYRDLEEAYHAQAAVLRTVEDAAQAVLDEWGTVSLTAGLRCLSVALRKRRAAVQMEAGIADDTMGISSSD